MINENQYVFEYQIYFDSKFRLNIYLPKVRTINKMKTKYHKTTQPILIIFITPIPNRTHTYNKNSYTKPNKFPIHISPIK